MTQIANIFHEILAFFRLQFLDIVYDVMHGNIIQISIAQIRAARVTVIRTQKIIGTDFIIIC